MAVDIQGARGARGHSGPRGPWQPEETARHLLDQAGLAPEVQTGSDTDAARATAEPGPVWRSGPAPGSQAAAGGRVRLWVNPQGAHLPPHGRGGPPYPAGFRSRTVLSTLWACWSTRRVKSCWA